MKISLIFLSLLLVACSQVSRMPNSSESSVLYIGDSQSAGFLGGLVHDHLKTRFKPENIQVYGVSSSSPRHWADPINTSNGAWLCQRKGRDNSKWEVSLKEKICKGQKDKSVYSYLNRDKPEFIIFQFLGNSVGWSEKHIKSKLTSLLQGTENQDCLFITSPPHYFEKEDRNILRLKTEQYFINAIGDRCKIVRGMTEENLKVFAHQRDNFVKDKVHMSKKGASTFFEQIRVELP